jgi:hypothetical protein
MPLSQRLSQPKVASGRYQIHIFRLHFSAHGDQCCVVSLFSRICLISQRLRKKMEGIEGKSFSKKWPI